MVSKKKIIEIMNTLYNSTYLFEAIRMKVAIIIRAVFRIIT